MTLLFALSALFACMLMLSCRAVPDRTHDLRIEEVAYDVDGTVCRGYLAYDQKVQGKRPGVLVVHEWWGLNDYPKMRARMLAELGYTALAVDMFGQGRTATEASVANELMTEALAHPERSKRRFVVARDLLADHETVDRAKIGAVGYCYGGAVALGMARQGVELAAVASFHGSLGTDHKAKEGSIRGKILVCQGGADPFVKPEEVEAFRAEMQAAKADCRIEIYPGVVHAFTSEQATANGKKFGLPLAYDEKADKQSWASMQETFAAAFR